MIDVCICTHNPQVDLFQTILQALVNQTIDRSAFQVWVIDNASNPPIDHTALDLLAQANIKHHLIFEPKLGIMYGRRRAIESTTGDLLLYVDDDNELAPDYLERAVEIAQNHPEIGCFGGKLLLPEYLSPPQWLRPLLPYLAIKDLGELAISQCLESYTWAEGEPPTAGMVVRRIVLDLYLSNLSTLPPKLKLGRSGREGLLSSEDSLLASGAYQLNLACSYQPKLKLTHHIEPRRLEFNYQLKLLFGYGCSDVLLKQAMGITLTKKVLHSIAGKLRAWWKSERDLRYLACHLAIDFGYIYQLNQKE